MVLMGLVLVKSSYFYALGIYVSIQKIIMHSADHQWYCSVGTKIE